MKPYPCLRACFLALLAIPAVAGAEPDATQPVRQLQQFAESFVGERLAPAGKGARTFATAGNVDPRLRLQRCAGDLQGIMPSASTVAARLTVGVRCANPAWTVYVPVAVETELEVLVTRAAGVRNSSLGDTDVELQRRRVPGAAASYLTSVEQLRGRHLKAAVGAGTALTIDLLAADILIKRGQRVTLVATAGGVEVLAQGEAVADATPSGRVRVQNLSSRKIVEGQVESSDRVRVSL